MAAIKFSNRTEWTVSICECGSGGDQVVLPAREDEIVWIEIGIPELWDLGDSDVPAMDVPAILRNVPAPADGVMNIVERTVAQLMFRIDRLDFAYPTVFDESGRGYALAQVV